MLNVVNLNMSDRKFTIQELIDKKDKITINQCNWDNLRKSHFIESIIMRVPISNIYWHWNEDNNIQLITGEERLCALFDFVQNKFSLKGLKFFVKYEGMNWNTMEHHIRRRILESYIPINSFDPGTKTNELNIVIEMIKSLEF